MHKLTNVEAQRVIAVMEDTLDKLNNLTHIPCTSQTDLLEALTEAGESSVKSSLQMQWHVERMALKSVAMGSDVKARETAPGGNLERAADALTSIKYHEIEGSGNINNISSDVIIGRDSDGSGAGIGVGTTVDMPNGDSLERIYQSTRALCRTLRRSPKAMEVLLAFATEHPRLRTGILFNQHLSDLTGIMCRRLSTTVEEEAAKRQLLQELTEREKLAEDERDALQQMLHATRTEKEREVSALDAAIKKRREELQEVTRANATEMESIRTKASEAIAKAEDEHEQKSRALRERFERLAKETQETAETFQVEEAAARKKKAKAEMELTGAVSKYDRHMTSLTAKLEEIKAKMVEEREELAVLKEHFDRVDASARQQWAEEERIAAAREKEADAIRVVDGAATRIQSAFRGARARAEFQKAKKKGKKGGKGKGGKGKGGKGKGGKKK